MGIVVACLALEKLLSDGQLPSYPVEVLAFADEEVVRFPTALLGPRALAGTVDTSVFEMVDRDGMALGDALRDFGGDPRAIPQLARNPADVRAYLEVHIEQGPVLETNDTPLGVVTGICGIERNTVTFRGETGHAGTVPMAGRADALVAAADFISLAHDSAQNVPDLRATVGTCEVSPNVANGIPDVTELTFEVRAPTDQAREDFAKDMRVQCGQIARKRGVTFDMQRTYEQQAVPCVPELVDLFCKAVTATGHEPLKLPSGATHDASAMADLCDIGMLFVRCRGGVSHRPEEFASADDMGAAIDALAAMLLGLDDEDRVSSSNGLTKESA